MIWYPFSPWGIGNAAVRRLWATLGGMSGFRFRPRFFSQVSTVQCQPLLGSHHEEVAAHD